MCVDKEPREALREVTGSDAPALVLDDGSGAIGEAIRRCLDEQFVEPPEAQAHRLKAPMPAAATYKEECKCWQPATR